MSAETARKYLAEHGMEDRIHTLNESTATVAEAAHALRCEPERIAKTLAFTTDEGAVLVVTAGDTRVDNRKFRARFGAKPKMVRPDDAEAATGHAPGGVCPFGTAPGVRVFLDSSLRRFDTIFPAGGSAHTAVELSPSELAACLPDAEWVDVCRLPGDC